MKLIPIAEAAERIGVSRQTLENWGRLGIVKVMQVSDKRRTNWVDADTIRALGDSMADVEHTRIAIEKERAETQEYYRTLHERTMALRREVYMLDRFGRMFIAKEFYLSIPTMLERIGVLSAREAQVMRWVIEGQGYDEIGDRLGVTRGRVNQIFFKDCRKARRLEGIKDCMQENERLRNENTELKACMQLMSRDLKVQQAAEKNADGNDEADEKLKLLNTRITDCDLTVRSINCLRSANIKTIGELCRVKTSELIKFRNFGKKSLTELDNFLEERGLCFGMDVDSLYRGRIGQILEEEKQ